MKYISIGETCAVKYQINKFKGESETLFFDWLMTSMNGVIHVLECNDIDTILFHENIVRCSNDPYHNNHSRILIKSLDFCISIHDISKEFTQDETIDFINKYKRRFQRMIEYINSDEKLIFIRYGKTDLHLRDRFIETVLKINPMCDFCLVVIDHDIHNNECIHKSQHCLYIELNTTNTQTTDIWTNSFLDWKNIFLDIEKNV